MCASAIPQFIDIFNVCMYIQTFGYVHYNTYTSIKILLYSFHSIRFTTLFYIIITQNLEPMVFTFYI